MKSKIVLTASLIFFVAVAFGQKNLQDVVYLKNGSIIHGIITEFIPDKSVKIETEGNNVFVFEMQEVEKVTKEVASKAKRDLTPYIKKKGFFNETELGMLLGKSSDDSKTTDFSVSTVNGYQVNRHFRIGAGVGIDHYGQYNHTFLPVFGRVSGDVVKFWVTPVYFVDAGYGFLFEKDEYTNGAEERSSDGGLMLQGGVGLKFYTPTKVSFTLAFGYKVQMSEREYVYNYYSDYVYKEERIYRRHTLRLGINF